LRYFREDDVKRLAEPRQAIKAIRGAFARDFQTTVQMPVRTRLDLGGNTLLLMPCHDAAIHRAGVKTVTIGPQSGIHAIYTLIDSSAGIILALMEANYLTDLRTAATSAIVTELLSRADVKTLGIFGTGRQAFAHFAVLPLVRRFDRYLVCGSGRTDTSAFCERAEAELGIRVESVGARTCVSESDVICTCTTSSQPLFDGKWLRPGMHLNLIGAYQPSSREVDSKTIQRARVVVETYDGCMAEAGDLLIPMNEQAIDQSHILADLHAITSLKKSVRSSAADITLFKSVGCALEDLVVARLVYEKSHV
jgi:ornithine cyclodeaminase/alanine dehydrogenase-like protein (mu-crystallin family)